MRAAKRQVDEINRLKEAVKKTKSIYLINDYEKNILALIEELKEYCMWRGFDFQKVISGDFSQ